MNLLARRLRHGDVGNSPNLSVHQHLQALAQDFSRPTGMSLTPQYPPDSPAMQSTPALTALPPLTSLPAPAIPDPALSPPPQPTSASFLTPHFSQLTPSSAVSPRRVLREPRSAPHASRQNLVHRNRQPGRGRRPGHHQPAIPAPYVYYANPLNHTASSDTAPQLQSRSTATTIPVARLTTSISRTVNRVSRLRRSLVSRSSRSFRSAFVTRCSYAPSNRASRSASEVIGYPESRFLVGCGLGVARGRPFVVTANSPTGSQPSPLHAPGPPL